MSYAVSACRAFRNGLATIDHLLAKAQAANLGDEILADRLADDMFPLELQVRVALNQVLLALDQVAQTPVPLEATPYPSLTDARDAVARVRAHLDRVQPSNWADADATVDLTLPNGIRFVMTAAEDIDDWLMPNFYFHLAMTYALLRRAGLVIGKADFVGHMERHKRPAP